MFHLNWVIFLFRVGYNGQLASYFAKVFARSDQTVLKLATKLFVPIVVVIVEC